MPYTSITKTEEEEMLRAIGVKSIEELFADVPDQVKIKGLLNIPPESNELEVTDLLNNIASSNDTAISFLGAGSYQHYVPAAVDHLSSRSEFYTAYTPYQPEVSQGTLTTIFEFQSMICELTGQDVANAGMYDGATSLAESVILASRMNGKGRALVSGALNPNYYDVLKTYAWASDISLVTSDLRDGMADIENISSQIDDSISSIVIQTPNFFGLIEDIKKIIEIAHDKKAVLIVCVTEPLSLAMLKSPGSLGADIVCGEAQGFGNYPGFGGPLLGFMAVKNDFVRRIPGRLVGKATDEEGREAYVLTLQTREQHIRREKATSNICSNEALVALRAVIYMSLMGPRLRDLARLNHANASYLKKSLLENGFKVAHNGPYFNEFVVRHSNIKDVTKKARSAGFVPGLYLGDYFKNYSDALLVCATEFHSKEVIDRFIESL